MTAGEPEPRPVGIDRAAPGKTDDARRQLRDKGIDPP
jgi:hypothetical protein